MNKDLINNLKKLRDIEPDDQFVSETRNLLVGSETPLKEAVVTPWSWVFGTSAMVAVLVLIAVFITPQQPKVSSLNVEVMQQELTMLNSYIETLDHSQNVNNTVASALTEISDSRTNHLNESIIKGEQQLLEELENSNEEKVDKLLDQVIF